MSIYKIPNLSINGAGGANQRTLFNGYIYSLSYDIKMGSEGMSTVIANLISEDGTYSIGSANLNLSQSYSISIGSNLNLQMYLKRYKLKVSPKGNLLEIEFIDGSFLLDRILIGLHKKHGCNSSFPGDCPVTFGEDISSCLIILGHEINPCDTTYVGESANIANYLDPCHPCNKDTLETAQSQLKLVDCNDDAKYKILQVKYNFTELISKLQNYGININQVTDPNPTYFNEYTGTLREVLSSWCADFGWIFYWENNSINFMDLRTTINVNTTIGEFCPNLAEYEQEYTLDGTFQSTLITNYGREGKNRSYECQDAVHILIPPFNVSTTPNSQLAISKLLDETASGLSFYARELRELWYWFDKYQVIDSSVITPGFNIKELGLTVLSNPITLSQDQSQPILQTDSLEPSTSLSAPPFTTDPALLDNVSVDLDFMTTDLSQFPDLDAVRNKILDNDQFLQCFNLLASEDQWNIAFNGIDNKYFFIGFHDESVENEYYSSERDFAENFMGKFHIFLPNLFNDDQKNFFEDYEFISEDNTCNTIKRIKQDGRIKFDIEGPRGGNAGKGGDTFKYYNNLGTSDGGDIQTLADMPFARFLSIFRDQGDPQGASEAQQDFKLVCVEKGHQSWSPGAGITTASAVGSDDNDPPIHSINNGKLIGMAHSYYPKKLSIKHDDRGEDMVRVLLQDQNLNAYDVDKNKLFIFMGTSVPQDAFGLTKAPSYNPNTEIGLPYNGKPLNPNTEPDPTRQVQVVYQYPSLLCLPVGNEDNFANYVSFNTPAGQFNYYEPSYSNYGVVIEKTRYSYQKLNKLESVFIDGECPSSTTLKHKMTYKDISDESIGIIGRVAINGGSSATTCAYDLSLVEAVHQAFAEDMSVTQDTPLMKQSFTVGGIDIEGSPTIGDGLQNIHITVDEGGVKSTYTFGTTLMIPPAKLEVYDSQLQALLQNVTFDKSHITPTFPTPYAPVAPPNPPE